MTEHLTDRERTLSAQIDEQGKQVVALRDRAIAAEAELARLRAQEPVGWIGPSGFTENTPINKAWMSDFPKIAAKLSPVYAAPPAQPVWTPEELAAAKARADEYSDWFVGKPGATLPAQPAEPVAWKHDCAGLCTNDVELWIDACPHCGKPRAAPPAQAQEPWDRDVFKGADGLRKLLDSQPYWDEQSYGTRLYFGPNINDYLHRDVLRAAVEYLERAAPPAQPVHSNEFACPLCFDDPANIAQPAEPVQPQWLPIDSAPMTGKPLLLYWRHAGWMRGRFVNDESGDGWMCDGDQVMPRNQADCTHWMPIPAAPKGTP